MRTRLHLLGIVVWLVASPTSHAASIGINYVTIDQSTYLAPTDVAGVVPQSNWNNVKIGGPEPTGPYYLSDDSGHETTSHWPGVSQQVTTSVAPTTPNGKLLHGGTLVPISVESPYQHFDLYVYLAPSYFPVTSVFIHLAIPGPGRSVLMDNTLSSELIEATSTVPGNYLRFSNLSNPFFQISPNPFPVAITLTPEVVIAAVQIVEVPEPASWLLGLMGAAVAATMTRGRAGKRSV